MWKKARLPGSVLFAAVLLFGCGDQKLTLPGGDSAPDPTRPARLLQPGQFEEPCDSTVVRALLNAAGSPVGEVTVWNGPTMAYARLRASAGWELTEVWVGGARTPGGFPRTGGVVDPRRFQFGGVVSPALQEVVIEALHLGNPYNVLPGDDVLLAAFARPRPVGGSAIDAWARGTPFVPGQHPMHFPYTVQVCPPPNQPPTAEITAPEDGAGFAQGEPIEFAGTGHDPEDGELTGEALVWTSSRDGQIGTGTGFTRDDLSAGTHVIVLTATDSGGLTGTDSVTITVAAGPGSITLEDVTVGSGLMVASGGALLPAAPPGGTTVRIESSNPARVLLSLNSATAGTASIELALAEGVTVLGFWVHAVEGQTGAATLTATAAGFADGTATATAVQTQLSFQGLSASINVNAPDQPFRVRVAVPNLPNEQLVRRGGGGLEVTVASSNAAVARLVTSTAAGASVTARIPEGATLTPATVAAGGVALDPLTVGSTTITAAAAGAAGAEQQVTVNPSQPPPGSIKCGDLHPDSITQPGQIRVHTFSGSIGDDVLLTLVNTSNWGFASTARATIVTPSGAVMASFTANAHRRDTLPETGLYRLRVMADNLIQTGTYNFGLECLRPLGPTEGHLRSGDLFSGNINASGKVDLLTFDGSAGDDVLLTLVNTSNWGFASTARATILTPSGAVMASFTANAQRRDTLPESGTYIIYVQANNLVQTGSYNIGLESLRPLGPTEGHLQSGDLFSGNINASGKVDLLTFDGSAGDDVLLTLVNTSNWGFASTARATILTPSGAVMASFTANAQRRDTLPESGTYIIYVQANNLVQTGSYNISFLRE
jgi:hypothetical protein